MDKYHLEKPDSYSRYSLKISICTEIMRIRKLKATRHASELYGWPIDINFATLPVRIMKIKEVIQSRVTNQAALGHCFIWEGLLDDINRTGLTVFQIAQKGMNLPAAVTSLARPG